MMTQLSTRRRVSSRSTASEAFRCFRPRERNSERSTASWLARTTAPSPTVFSCTSLMGLRKKRYVLRQDALTLDAERGGFVVDGRFAVSDQPTKKPEREAVPTAGA